jgi:small acid-soluble spore protein F (minor alpha/beta-type SASP)
MPDQKPRSVMSQKLKDELARELGVAETVTSEGWGAVSARKCGMLTKLAIERAERSLGERAGDRGAR